MNLQGCFLASFWVEQLGNFVYHTKIGNNYNNNNNNNNNNDNDNGDKTNSSLDLLDETSPFQQEHPSPPL